MPRAKKAPVVVQPEHPVAAALPDEGGFYAWVRRALGPFWGFQEAWLSLAASGGVNEVKVAAIKAAVDAGGPFRECLRAIEDDGADVLMLGSSHRTKLVNLLKGNVITEVAKNLPENIQLVIHS